jgi:hypothetical protein
MDCVPFAVDSVSTASRVNFFLSWKKKPRNFPTSAPVAILRVRAIFILTREQNQKSNFLYIVYQNTPEHKKKNVKNLNLNYIRLMYLYKDMQKYKGTDG